MDKKSQLSMRPSRPALDEARKNQGGWVYEIRGNFRPNNFVPPHAITGAWKVNIEGNIVGDFIPKPNFGKKKP